MHNKYSSALSPLFRVLLVKMGSFLLLSRGNPGGLEALSGFLLPKLEFSSMKFRKPCLDCGALSYDTRCEIHTRRLQQLKDVRRAEHKKTLYNSDYRKQAKIVRDTAIICHLCKDGPRANDPWQADHIDAGNPNSPLAAAHRSCNAARGDKPLS